jgi:hypothetical protein
MDQSGAVCAVYFPETKRTVAALFVGLVCAAMCVSFTYEGFEHVVLLGFVQWIRSWMPANDEICQKQHARYHSVQDPHLVLVVRSCRVAHRSTRSIIHTGSVIQHILVSSLMRMYGYLWEVDNLLREP